MSVFIHNRQLHGYSITITALSLTQSNIYMFKADHRVPVPKNTKATCLNDNLPVALTSVAMKRF